MEPGDFLETREGESRYRTEGLVEAGRSFQIVRCTDTAEGDREVYAKAPRYERENEDRGEERDQWRAALGFETEVLERGIDGLPTFVELLEVEAGDDGADGEAEPVLVYEPIRGGTLYDFVAKRPTGTISVDLVLEQIRAVGEVCRRVHAEGLVFRDLDPRHVVVTDEGAFVGMVGTGNVAAVDEPPTPVASRLADAPYAAPEIRNARSSETLTPAADVYGLAALASYALTGQEPTSAVESPLTGQAYEALDSVMIDGLDHLVAMGLQPVAKHRVELDELLDRATDGGLAELSDAEVRSELEVQPLPEPWAGAEPPGVNRAEQSNLSPGPLISVPGDDAATATPDEQIEGVKSAPVREFLGETDDEADDSESSRTDEAGEAVREVSMVDENLQAGDAPEQADAPETRTDWEQRAADSPLPPLSELPLAWRLGLAVGVPVIAIGLVVLLGLLGAY